MKVQSKLWNVKTAAALAKKKEVRKRIFYRIGGKCGKIKIGESK